MTGIVKRLEELEKENAELKEQDKVDLRQIQAILNQRSIQNTKLTKAIEILKDLLLMAKIEHLEDRYESVADAEQFIKEIEK